MRYWQKGAVQVVLVIILLIITSIVYSLFKSPFSVIGARQGPPDKCPNTSIWNGTICKPITYNGETAVVGLDAPVASRTELDEIERSFIKRSFSRFPQRLFDPNSQSKGQEIQDIRLNNHKLVGSDYERTWEFLINTDAKSQLDANQATLGADAVGLLIKHAEAVNEIWANSQPKINRRARAVRIIIVAGDVLSQAGGGWRVVNDHSFGWWANDDLNNVRGFIAYDIDSRWALEETWPPLVMGSPNTFQGVKIDYGLLHELTHHMPVGDNYVYNMGSGHGLEIPQPNGNSAFFNYSSLSFMYNDHMSGPSQKELTAPSSYHIQFYWKNNPKYIRNPQDNPYAPPVEVYGRFFYNTLNIRLGGLDQAGVEGCNYLRQSPTPSDPSSPVTLLPSSEVTSVSYSSGECTVVLNKDQQLAAFPGGYIGLQKGGLIFPVYIPRNLMETLYWKDNSLITPFEYTFNLSATAKLSDAIDNYISKINSGSGRVDMSPHSIWAYMDVVASSALPADTVLYGTIDNLENQYIYEYRYPNCRQFDGNIEGCNAAPGCAYYSCADQCWPRGTPIETVCP